MGADDRSLAELLAALPEEERRTVRAGVPAAALREWAVWARPSQVSPWSPLRGPLARAEGLARYAGAAWIAGRGYGKTRLGAEAVIEESADPRARIALVGRSAADVREVMVEGESGILARSPPHNRPRYEPSKRRLTWPSGARASTYSADEPDQLRGPQHSFAWADELAAWARPDAWTQLRFGLRLGPHPRWIVTTTPRPTSIVREIVRDPRAWVVRGSTHANAANLSPDYLDALARRYAGTAIGRQEIDAEILSEAPGALWRRAWIDAARIGHGGAAPALDRIVVAVDPAVTSGEDSDETGIVVAGVSVRAGHAYVLEDLSGRMSPDAWARCAVEAYERHRADRIVAEANNGGDLVRTVLAGVSSSAAIRLVHASRGKVARAEPVAALYEQGRVHHAAEGLAALEDQLVTWEQGAASPDRLDALVWALTDLVLDGDTLIVGASDGLDRASPLDDWRTR